MASLNLVSTYSPTNSTSVVTEHDLEGLPAPVQRYMHFSKVVGKAWIKTVHLKYSGKFRMAVDKPWMPLNATQFYSIDPPGFLWKAQFKMMGVPFMFASDTYKQGHSHMSGKVAKLFTVVDGQSDEIDQGTMVRYLQEMAWFPTAYLGENIQWHPVDNHAADVTLVDSGKRVTGRMYFDDMGRMLNFAAERYGEFNGQYQMKTWTTPMTEYAVVNGMNIPVAGMGVWLMPGADFAYIHVRLETVAYNVPIETF